MSKLLKDVIKVIKDEIKTGSKSLLTMKNNTNELVTRNSPFAVELEIQSIVDRRLVSAFTSFASRSAELMGLTISRGPAVLQPQIDRWTVLSSPFVHKTARTQFERRRHCHAMLIEGIWNEETAAKYVWYLNRHVPNEVELSIKMHERLEKEITHE